MRQYYPETNNFLLRLKMLHMAAVICLFVLCFKMFFCCYGDSGTLPLAKFLVGRGHLVETEQGSLYRKMLFISERVIHQSRDIYTYYHTVHKKGFSLFANSLRDYALCY
jgi:hypothetical protein